MLINDKDNGNGNSENNNGNEDNENKNENGNKNDLDYEDFASRARALYARFEKSLEDCSEALSERMREVETADFGFGKSAEKRSAALALASENVYARAREFADTVAAFDIRAFMASGAYSRQFKEACLQASLDVVEDGASFEVFPFRVRVDAANGEVYVDNRRASVARPAALAAQLVKERTRLLSAPFFAARFAQELSVAYDTAILHKKKRQPSTRDDADVQLLALHAYLTPMQRFRREYDRRSYAFDLARFCDAQPEKLPDGRVWEFAPPRDVSSPSAIRVTNPAGKAFYLTSIRFVRPVDTRQL